MEPIYMSMTEEQTRQYYGSDQKQTEKMIWELARTAQQIANDKQAPVRIYTCSVPVTEIQPMIAVPSNPPIPLDKKA